MRCRVGMRAQLCYTPTMSAAQRPVLTLIDGSSYIFRAYHAIRAELSTSSGLPTRAVFGFSRMLIKTLREAGSDHVAVVWDRDGKAARQKIDPEYKAHRPPMPDDLKQQLPYIRQVVDVLAVPSVEKEGWEADDVIASLARVAIDAGYDVVVVTGDKDFSQLVGPHLRLYDGMQGRWTGPEEVEARWGVTPERFLDMQALLGDSVDNIPGIPGVGEKTAARLIQEHGSLEEVLAAAERGEIGRKKIREALLEGKERLAINKQLVRLRGDLELPFELDDLQRREPDAEEVRSLFRELEFFQLLRELPAILPESEDGETVEQGSVSLPETELVGDDAALAKLLERIDAAPRLALRVAPPGEPVVGGEIVGIALAFPEGPSAYVPLGHRGMFLEKQLPAKETLAAILAAIGDRPWVGAHTKRDLVLLQAAGFPWRQAAGDLELAAYLLNPARRSFEVSDLAKERLDIHLAEYASIAGTGKERRAFAELEPKVAGEWLAGSAAAALAVEEALRKDLEAAGLLPIYEELELPVAKILAEMESWGVRLDVDGLAEFSRELEEKLADCLARCWEAAGREFNVASPKQLAQVLFSELELPVIKRTKTGPSTDHEVLEKLAEQHPLPALILEHRSLAKLKGTYVDTLPLLVGKDGRLHTTFDQSGTATGRLASSEPNLMNIPIRTEMGKRIRRAFVADPGYVLLSADYSQIELRILAHVSGDPVLSEALRAGADIHNRTAAEVFGVPEDAVPPEQREIAKMVNYAVAYGLTAFGLSARLDIPGAEASAIIKRYFERYAGIQAWIDRTLETAKESGYVSSIYGRRRYLPDLRSRNGALRQAAERAAINMPIQGSAADIMKRAMILVDRALRESGSEARLLLQVHDELVVEVPEGELDAVRTLVCERMSAAAQLDVPLVVEASHGATWDH